MRVVGVSFRSLAPLLRLLLVHECLRSLLMHFIDAFQLTRVRAVLIFSQDGGPAGDRHEAVVSIPVSRRDRLRGLST